MATFPVGGPSYIPFPWATDVAQNISPGLIWSGRQKLADGTKLKALGKCSMTAAFAHCLQLLLYDLPFYHVSSGM